MDANKFINQQVEMIKNDFGLDQIKDNIYRYFVRYHLPNITLDALIHRCMEMYAEVLKRHSQMCKSCGKNIAEVCGNCLSDIAQGTADQAMNSCR